MVSVSLRSIIHSYSTPNLNITCPLYISFRLLTEYHSFLYIAQVFLKKKAILRFPSPYGVSFILMHNVLEALLLSLQEFPSPYGVSFILILNRVMCENLIEKFVSVSLRSIIHSYKIFIDIYMTRNT